MHFPQEKSFLGKMLKYIAWWRKTIQPASVNVLRWKLQHDKMTSRAAVHICGEGGHGCELEHGTAELGKNTPGTSADLLSDLDSNDF